MSRKSALVVSCLLGVVACTRPAQPAAGANVTAVLPDCSGAVAGTDPAAVRLRRAQQLLQLKAAAADAGPLLAVARAWLGLSRARSQPAYQRHALACAEQVLGRDPADAAALRIQALVWLDEHRFADARDLAQRLLARDPHDVQSWGIVSDAELELGHVEQAEQAAQRMLDLKPGTLAYGRAAHLRWLRGDRAGAKQLYQRAIAAASQAEVEPRAWLIVQAAWVFWHEGDYAGAQRGFELAASLVPDYAPALAGLGRTALSLGDARAALRWLGRAQAAHPLAETAWWLADAYLRLGDSARAADMFRELERLGARSEPRTLALFHALRGEDPARALSLARRAYAERADCYSRDVLAYALFRDGRLQEAARLAREVSVLGIPDAGLMRRAGQILRAAADPLGDTLIARAAALHPSYETSAELATEVADARAQLR